MTSTINSVNKVKLQTRPRFCLTTQCPIAPTWVNSPKYRALGAIFRMNRWFFILIFILHYDSWTQKPIQPDCLLGCKVPTDLARININELINIGIFIVSHIVWLKSDNPVAIFHCILWHLHGDVILFLFHYWKLLVLWMHYRAHCLQLSAYITSIASCRILSSQ